MGWRIRQFSAIARLTALEVVRQPICLLISLSCIAFIALLPALITHTLGEGARMVRDSGLAFFFVCGLILGAYGACSSLAHEIRRGTAATVLTKPVSRALFLPAKYAGVAIVMVFFSIAAISTIIVSTRTASLPWSLDWWSGLPMVLAPVLACLVAGIMNFMTRKPFSSSAFVLLILFVMAAFGFAGFTDAEGQPAPFGSLLALNIVPAGILIALAVLVLTAIAVSLAIRLDTVPTLSICSVIFLLGLMSDHLFGRHAQTSRMAAFFYSILPNWQNLWLLDALNNDAGIPLRYLGQAGLYCAFYLAGILALGILAFKHMEVKS